jgi:hypothetical protein
MSSSASTPSALPTGNANVPTGQQPAQGTTQTAPQAQQPTVVQTQTHIVKSGFVKSVNSGDSMIIRGAPRNVS